MVVAIGGSVGDRRCPFSLDLADHHGSVARATGTGQTITMQVLVEGLLAAGVLVFVADMKGDVLWMGVTGTPSVGLDTHGSDIKMAPSTYSVAPTVFRAVFGKTGQLGRTPVTKIGLILLARMLRGPNVRQGMLQIA